MDHLWMQRALRLAAGGRGHVEPNPLVGAVLVRDGRVVGEGWHQRYGEAHAEIHALAAAGEAARGATLYVTLEPCCHHGKTPPCTEALRRAGVRRVVAAMGDPFPRVAGQGVAELRGAGIDVELGVEEHAARRLNAPYLKLLATSTPYVHAKWAMSLDGKIATHGGDSRWISGAASRRRVHELRGRMDAILVGIGTALADDPLLTPRPPGPRLPLRIVLDSRARLPAAARLVSTARDFPTLVVVGAGAEKARLELLKTAGCEVLCLPEKDGRIPLPALLAELGRRHLTNLLVEGGATVLGTFLEHRAIDEVHVFLAGKLLGGGRTPFDSPGVDRIADAVTVSGQVIELLEGDVYFHGWREKP